MIQTLNIDTIRGNFPTLHQEVNGKPLVYWVWRQAMQSRAVSVTVATDDIRIQEAMTLHGAEVVMTDANHPSGTDRLAEVARLKASRSNSFSDHRAIFGFSASLTFREVAK